MHNRGAHFHYSMWQHPMVLDRGMELSAKHSEEVTVHYSCTHMLHFLWLTESSAKLLSMHLILHAMNLIAIACSEGTS